jgi:predicted TIM-barrel fold metal-dependent hydrolase
MIIDAHTHLGDILYSNGGKLIEKKGVKKKFVFDPISLSEWTLHLDIGGIDYDSWLYKQVVIADRARNLTATRENMRKAMDKNGVSYCAVMPIPPYVNFSDLQNAAAKDPGILPFTGVDFSQDYDFESAIAEDVKNGAKGIKLHPILHNTPLTDEMTFNVVEAFSRHELPILFHSGISHYYIDEAEKQRTTPEYGEIHYARELIKAFPKTKFIVAHAGIFLFKDVLELLAGFPNIWVDVSIQPPSHIRKLVDIFGIDKILNASDWPWGKMWVPIQAVKWACRGDKAAQKRILYENAAELMRISI